MREKKSKNKTRACDYTWVDNLIYVPPIHNDDGKKVLEEGSSGLPSGSRKFQVRVKKEIKRQIQ